MSWIDNLTPFATRDQLHRLENTVSAQQIALDALAAKIKADDAILGKLGTDVTTIASGVTGLQKTSADLQSQLDALKKQNPALDFTGVNVAMASFDSDLGTVLTAADSVVTTLTPPPPPAPAPAP